MQMLQVRVPTNVTFPVKGRDCVVEIEKKVTFYFICPTHTHLSFDLPFCDFILFGWENKNKY